MKRLILALALLVTPFALEAKATNDGGLVQRLQLIEDRVALRTLVDTFSELADRKDVDAQVLLFTEDASVDSFSGGKTVSSLKGRQEIGATFARYLALFETVYHHNGQQTVEIHGDTATGTAYCYVVLIANANGKRTRNTAGVVYHDEYVRRAGHWLIAKRQSNFIWRDAEEMAPAAR